MRQAGRQDTHTHTHTLSLTHTHTHTPIHTVSHTRTMEEVLIELWSVSVPFFFPFALSIKISGCEDEEVFISFFLSPFSVLFSFDPEIFGTGPANSFAELHAADRIVCPAGSQGLK